MSEYLTERLCEAFIAASVVVYLVVLDRALYDESQEVLSEAQRATAAARYRLQLMLQQRRRLTMSDRVDFRGDVVEHVIPSITPDSAVQAGHEIAEVQFAAQQAGYHEQEHYADADGTLHIVYHVNDDVSPGSKP